MKSKVMFLLLGTLFLQCKKDTPSPNSDPCDLAYTKHSNPYNYIYKGGLTEPCNLLSICHIYPDKYIYSYPSFNPSNPYEICYLRDTPSLLNPTSNQLFKYNFCTNSITLIANSVSGYTSWSKKDWIVFTGKGGQLWKVKSNGDSLTQLTKKNPNNAKWSPSGAKLLFFDSALGLTKMRIINEDGTDYKIIPRGMSNYNWLDEQNILYSYPKDSLHQYFLYNIENNTAQLLCSVSEKGAHGEISFDSQCQDMYFDSQDGLYRYNLQSKELVLLAKDYFPSYNLVSSSYMKSKILYNRILIDTLKNAGGPCCFNFYSHIAIMNTDGTDERQVLIPE